MVMNGTSRRILLIGTDGLRPDLFDPVLMPTYAGLMAQGTRLAAHHAIYPSHTRAIISAINTGCTPGKHGLLSSRMRVDGATENHIVDTSKAEQLASLDRLTGGRAIMMPTLADLLERQGVGMAIAGAQTSGGGALWARKQTFPMVNTTTTYGRTEYRELWAKLGGDPPPTDLPHRIPHGAYAARAVTDLFLDDDGLRLIMLWLAEPDFSLHRFGLGSPEARRAMQACDESLASILDGLDKRGLRDQFDILLISDHGHSTVNQQGTIGEQLERAARDLGERMPPVSFASDNLYPMPNAPPPTASELQPLVAWFQQQLFTGALFGGTEEIANLPGVLPLAAMWNDTLNERAPLFSFSAAWSHATNDHGVPGTVTALVKYGGSRSTHGSASPYDMHAIGYAIGPDFHEGRTTDLPSGATDLAPTILALLGIEQPPGMDGRVLWEVMKKPTGDSGQVTDEVICPATNHAEGFRPSLRLHRVDETSYVHEVRNGNGP